MDVVLLDIEGTVAPITFVYDVMFPYVRRRLDDYLAAHWDEMPLIETRRRIADDASDATLAEATPRRLAEHVVALMDADSKATGLKHLQGLVWQEGFASGELTSQLFDDAAPAIRRWVEAGLRVCIYSSGSIAAQKLFFGHTEQGDLTPRLSGFFDTTSGPKREPASYRTIAGELGAAPKEIVFLSDVVAELAAARSAGLGVGLLVRPGNPAQPAGHGFPEYRSFEDVDLNAADADSTGAAR